ncbi:MAG: carbon-nitrogen family hydrolase [Clostridiaceae bacterium]|nr:carbon-nitrogen family hydrolase [Clostridiaceae bacterium]
MMRVSCIQMDMLPGRPDENFVHAETLIRQAAAAERPDVVVLPETWNTGFAPGKIDPACADTGGERTRRVFSALAKELKINIVAGSIADRRGGKLYNTAYVFDRTGGCVAAYDKTHLFTPMGEDKDFQIGSTLTRFSLDGVRCAVIICYDLRFPELTRTLALPGLDLLFVVSQWPNKRVPHLLVLAQARAIENQMFLVLCNSCGEAFGTHYGGHSAVLDPWGERLAQAGETETVISADLDLSVLEEIRSTIPVFRDRRPELYHIN